MCTPEVGYHHVRDSSATADSKVEIETQQVNFHEHRSYLHNLYTEQNKDASGTTLEFSKVLLFNFGVGEELVNGTLEMKEHFDEVWVRYTHHISEIPGLCVMPFPYICETKRHFSCYDCCNLSSPAFACCTLTLFLCFLTLTLINRVTDM